MTQELRKKFLALKEEGIEPRLDIILTQPNESSKSFIKIKKRKCEEVGVRVVLHETYELNTKQIQEFIDELTKKKEVHGILVQLPLRDGLDKNLILESIPSEKDVDGLSFTNMGRLILGDERLGVCTAKGIVELLERYDIPTSGANVVIINRSLLVGRPLAYFLLNRDSTVTICHSKTKDLKEHTKKADILVVAIGKTNFIDSSFIKDGCVVVDVGINKTENGLTGDVNFNDVKDKVSYISPVPGGVGPLTVIMVIKNLFNAIMIQNGKN